MWCHGVHQTNKSGCFIWIYLCENEGLMIHQSLQDHSFLPLWYHTKKSYNTWYILKSKTRFDAIQSIISCIYVTHHLPHTHSLHVFLIILPRCNYKSGLKCVHFLKIYNRHQKNHCGTKIDIDSSIYCKILFISYFMCCPGSRWTWEIMTPLLAELDSNSYQAPKQTEHQQWHCCPKEWLHINFVLV